MSKRLFESAFVLGLVILAWVAWGFVGTQALALAMTAVIAAVFVLGAWELHQFRAASAALSAALGELAATPQALPPSGLQAWLERVPAALRPAVRARVEGQPRALPGPALTPYLVGLLVMLGMLGTFLGMVVTFQGAVFALEASADLSAMRGALAEPIKGLGLAFGTSVAGVAASALLGLMSALARRERLELARRLDACGEGALRPFSPAHQREASLAALQAQADALPQVVAQLQALMDRIDERSQRLDTQLLARHEALQRHTQEAFTGLAGSVGRSLEQSLAAGARAAGDTLAPLVSGAMAQVVQSSDALHARLAEQGQAQVDALSRRFEAASASTAQAWTAAQEAQQRRADAAADRLEASLQAFGQTFEERSAQLLAQLQDQLAQAQAQQAGAEAQRLAGWSAALQGAVADLQLHWQQAAAQALAQHEGFSQQLSQAAQDVAQRLEHTAAAVAQRLEHTAGEVAQRVGEQAGRTLEGAAGLLSRSEELVRSRAEGEARWHAEHGQRMDQLAALWRTELAALRGEEAARGQAAVERLGALEAAVAQHLAHLGASLEAPLSRLLHTASEVPQAAAGVISQLRAEMSRMAERDNLALEERTSLLARLGELLASVNQATGEQRAAVESLVHSAGAVMAQAGERFGQLLAQHAGQAQDAAAQLGAGAVELASLGEAFTQGVQQFQAGSDQLLEGLQRIEAALARSTARSDEQLAYYVAQAREVIDLSISSQQGILEGLQQLKAPPERLLALDEDRARA